MGGQPLLGYAAGEAPQMQPCHGIAGRRVPLLRVALIFLSLLLAGCAATITIEHEQLVEACCCPKSQVDATFQEMFDILNRLVQRPYFCYYRVNLEKPCPYWAVELMCGMTDDGEPAPCQVCTCDAHEVPIALRNEGQCGALSQSLDNAAAENEVPIDVDRTLPSSMKEWSEDPSLWYSDTPNDPNAVYIDLVRNPEANTGYVGDGARRVWGAIYNENCFQGPPDKMCVAERAFFRLLSGLHVSISTHVAAHFYRKPHRPAATGAAAPTDAPDMGEWEPNLAMFMRTVGNWPDRVDNLYFLYMFVLRAVNKAKPFLLQLDISTGDAAQDALARAEVAGLLQARLVCTPTFNETVMFEGIENKQVILQQMRSHFFNISRLMDCLSCEKCRLWGKLETHGLGAALRVVIEDTPKVELDRLEIVALFNLLRQLSTSISNVQRLLRLSRESSGDDSPWFGWRT